MRYYEDNEAKNFIGRIVTEVLIHNILYDSDYVCKLYELLYDPSVELSYNKSNQYIYYIMEYCDLGPLMIRNFDDCKYYHNYDLIKLITNTYFKE
jgi:hypothetical protein